ncbi:MAG: lipid-A-disaccharide synthase [Thermodesulfovibrionales bacterium]
MTTIMIVAGESSGELYGSLLAKALKSKWPDIHIMGVGGEKMSEAGVELISSISDAFGLTEAISAFGKIKAAFNKTVEALKQCRPAVLVLIDYPDFNLKVAKLARSLGIKILYYVSPQVWAWRKGRVKKIACLVDRMAVILPFEEEIYRNAGIPCEFIGHPVLEEIESVIGSSKSFGVQGSALSEECRSFFKSNIGLEPNRPLLSLLPGSRPSELKRHLPLIIEVIRRFKRDPEISEKGYQLCMPLTLNTDETRYHSYLETLRQEGVVIKKGESVKVLAASDLAVVASGTATLQTAFLEVPMVVVYKLAQLTYQLGKRIIKVKHISLVNILSGREVVQELIQDRANPGEIVKELKKIITDTKYREDMIHYYRKVKGPFSGKNPSQRVAEIVIEMAGGGHL